MKVLVNRFLKTSRAALVLLAAFFAGEAFSQNWTSLPNMNRERFESSAVQYNDDIYVFNGFGKSIRIEPTVEKFDAATQKWSIVSGTSALYGNAVTHNGIVRVGNEVWIIGGRKGSHPGQVSNKVWKYNLSTGSWTAGPSMPQPVAAGGAALVNNKIHWFGGIDPQANCDVSNHYVYDLNQPWAGWRNITGFAAMPSPRNHFATAVLNGWIYAIGGQYGHDSCPGRAGKDTNLVHAFNPNTNQWVQKASLPAVQSHMEPSTFVYHGAIYVVGGEQNGNKIYRYHAAQNHWDTVGTLPGNLVAPVARVIDNKLVVASGGAPNAFSPTAATRSTSMAPFILPGTQPDDSSTTNDSNGYTSDHQSNVGGSDIQEGESYIAIEAEYFDTNSATTTHAWQTTNLSNSSNDAAVITTPDSGALTPNVLNSPGLGYLALFDKPGTWYVWLRGWGNTNSAGEGSSDSAHAGLNGQLSTSAARIDNFPAGWNWSNSTRDGARATIQIPESGINTFNLWMREDGLAIDKILLTTDSNYVPSEHGPEHTTGTSTEEIEIYTSTQQCNGLAVTVNLSLDQSPTLGDDVILGTSGNDIIDALDGNDTICALDGNDVITAGKGSDWIDAGPGDDTIDGGADADVIYGDSGSDTIIGGTGNDELYGEEDGDFIEGNSGNDTLEGGSGTDQLIGGDGGDLIETGPGGNRGTGLLVDGGAGNDLIFGGPDDDEIRGAGGNDEINGRAGDDALFGGSGNDKIKGQSGDDLIRGNSSADIISGGNGKDDINGGGGNDTLYGGNDDDNINGSTGNDLIFGGADNDVANGGGGNDVLYGNRGNDLLFGGGSNDKLIGGTGNDNCSGGSGTDQTSSCESDILLSP